ncbi:MAG: Rrf2 family transcriptional regulator [Candidatus Tantalella remota]|nr:Rrf2 family transcriptional regulator [Candidatus Tantalella remota]
MKMITRDTDYAIRTLTCIAGKKEKIVTVRDLTEELEMPKAYLRRVLQILNKKGILQSFKGRGGGFKLIRDPENITVFNLVVIFQGPFHLTEHLFKGRVCPYINTCYLKEKLDHMEGYVAGELKGITIASLMNNGFEKEGPGSVPEIV